MNVTLNIESCPSNRTLCSCCNTTIALNTPRVSIRGVGRRESANKYYHPDCIIVYIDSEVKRIFGTVPQSNTTNITPQ